MILYILESSELALIALMLIFYNLGIALNLLNQLKLLISHFG